MFVSHSPQHILATLAQQHVLVVGDVFLDQYIFGQATRLSREAPIPVLEFVRQQALPGGAANPAMNMAALGARALLGAVVGDDAEGRQLCALLVAAGVEPSAILMDGGRPTTVKTRIVSESALRFSQQLARIDRIDRTPVSAATAAQLVQHVERHAPQLDAVLCSDYMSGLLTPLVVNEIKHVCRAHRLLLTVDAQGELDKYSGVDLVRCNNDEAAHYLGYQLASEADYQRALPDLLEHLQPRLVIVTRGRDGVSLQGQEQPYAYLPAHRVEAADTTGAGDTFSAVMTLALAAGLQPVFGAQLANYAAGLVVRRLGNAVVTPDELAEGIEEMMNNQ
jgi:rfaE bifunctional protein kinase chain/domain